MNLAYAVVAALVVGYSIYRIRKRYEKQMRKFHPQPIMEDGIRIFSSSPFELKVTPGVDYQPLSLDSEGETEEQALERRWAENLPNSWWKKVRLFFRTR